MAERTAINNFSLSDSMNRQELTESPVLKAAEKSYEQLQKLKENAFIDNLTGAYNQNAWADFQSHFDQNRGGKTSIVMIDINGLKDLNDREGHSAGDEFIKKTVLYVKSVFSRTGDKVYRIGGDEIGVVCDYIPTKKRDEFNSYISGHFNPDVVGELGLDFAYGTAHTDPQQDMSIKSTIFRADMTMYDNKKEIKAANPDKYSR